MSVKLSIRSLCDMLQDIAAGHPQLEGRFKANLNKTWQPDFEKWPILYADARSSQTIITDDNVMRDIIALEVIVLDWDSRDEAQTNDIISDNRELVLEVTQLLRKALRESGYSLESIGTAELIYMHGIDGLTGWRIGLQIDAGAVGECGISGDTITPATPVCAPARIAFTSGKPTELAPSGSLFVVNDSGAGCPDVILKYFDGTDWQNVAAGDTFIVPAAEVRNYDTTIAAQLKPGETYTMAPPTVLPSFEIQGVLPANVTGDFAQEVSFAVNVSISGMTATNAKDVVLRKNGTIVTAPFNLLPGDILKISFKRLAAGAAGVELDGSFNNSTYDVIQPLYHPYTTKLINYLAGKSVTLSTGRKEAYDAFFKALEGGQYANYLEVFDIIRCYHTSNLTEAITNIIAPGMFTATVINTLTLTRADGFLGSTGSGLLSGFNLVQSDISDATKAKLNNFSILQRVGSKTNNAMYYTFGIAGGTGPQARITGAFRSTDTRLSIGNDTWVTGALPPNFPVTINISRTGATTAKFGYSGSYTDTFTGSALGNVQEMNGLLAEGAATRRDSMSFLGSYPGYFQFFAIGRALSDDEYAEVNPIIRDLVTALASTP